MEQTAVRAAREIKLYNADTLDYAGSIVVEGKEWYYQDLNHPELEEMTRAMPLKALLANLIMFNYVYDDIIASLE